MKTLIIISTLFILVGFNTQSDFYELSFETIDGEVKNMHQYRGKKVLILVLPASLSDADTSFLNAVNVAQKGHKERLIVTGVPSLEEGFTQAKSPEVKQWYKKHLDINIVIATPMFTKKTSPFQHALFSWLTDKNKNMHFNEDVAGPGHKFFISASGELNAVYDPQARLDEKILTTVMKMH